MDAPGTIVDHPATLNDRHGIETLDRTSCLQLLRSVPIGRIGVSIDALPAILPVNFVVARRDPGGDDVIVLRTTSGTKLDAAVQGNVVAFEADGYDAMDHSGWSVLVQGTSHVVDPAERAWADALPLRPWALSDVPFCVTISLDLVSGRRFGVEHPGR